MRKLYFTLLALTILLLTTNQIFAQSVDTKNVRVTYKQKPLKPLPKDIKTYSTMIRSGYIMFDDEAALERNYLQKLEGYQHVTQGGDLMILVTFRGLDIINREVKNDESKEKGKFNFRYNITYTFPMKYEIYNQSTGEVIEEREISGMHQEIQADFGKNNEFATEEQLVAGFKEQKNDFFINLENRKAEEFLKEVRNSLQNNYAYPTKTYTLKVGYGKSRKLDYTYQENAKNYAVRAYQLMNKGEDPLRDFQKAIEIWKEELESLDLNDKNARVNRKIGRWLHYNLAMAYTWMDDYESAENHLLELELVERQGLMANVDESELKRFIEDRKQRYNANL